MSDANTPSPSNQRTAQVGANGCWGSACAVKVLVSRNDEEPNWMSRAMSDGTSASENRAELLSPTIATPRRAGSRASTAICSTESKDSPPTCCPERLAPSTAETPAQNPSDSPSTALQPGTRRLGEVVRPPMKIPSEPGTTATARISSRPAPPK